MEANMEKVVDKALTAEHTGAHLRFERKFVFPETDHEDIIRHIQRMPFGFLEVYYKRKINNIYLDDANYNFYKQNVEGVAQRKKIRLRWYGQETSQIHAPNVEIKIKTGEVGDKITHKLSGLSFDLNIQTPDDILKSLLSANIDRPGLHQSLGVLHPALLNTYERRYFVSFCGRYRITTDYNQDFYNPNYGCSYTHSRLHISDVVLELKYGIEDDEDAREISQYISARLSKNSKYVNGINLLYHPEFL